uniref:Calpain-1 catalytic subunit-like n=1 Tax=Stegastes partitus TaxID=144197 RepID=A0A3B5A2E2_9TELE
MPPPGACLNIMENRSMEDGYGKFKTPDKFFGQDFQELKQYCLIKGVRYIDDMFPPDRNSIGHGMLDPSDLANVVWLRPAVSVTSVNVYVSRFDFGQGILGNCWFLASIGALTFQRHIFDQVVPPEQKFEEDYCGLFHFRFWRFGKWVDVVIDDKLPTINGRLIFVHSKNPNEFWPALLEKAYAKVCGSYTDMNAGTPTEAMMDFTGGVYMHIELSEPPPDLWELMCRAGKSTNLMSCGTPQGVCLSLFLYSAQNTWKQCRGTFVNLVRLWNPWGRGEWKGDWSDRSPLWQTVSPEDRELCHSVDDDGEFWMTLEDFCRFFVNLDICGLSPDFLDGNSSCVWKTSAYDGRWVAGITAGGCINNRDSFWTNPQYRVKLTGEYSEREGEKNMLVSLMQKPDKRNRRQVHNVHIGFLIYEYAAQKGKLPASFFLTHAPAAQTKTYLNARSVMELLMLKPGEYLIVPSTFKRNESASFLLTIHSKIDTQNAEEYKDKKDFFRQYSDKYEEVDAEQLQRLLNDKILKGDLKSGGFTIDACRSMVALMDVSVLSHSMFYNHIHYIYQLKPFIRLKMYIHDCPEIVFFCYQDIFYLTDVSRTGTLSLSELRNAFIAAEFRVSDDMLNLMVLRYGTSSGHMTLENFISLILRLGCMHSE